jgi:oligoribonuclease NrnB/cAMP/cGMP phosphodiesterase (DHH superfamily)
MNLLLTHTDPDGITPVILLNLINEEFEYLTFEPTEISKFIIEKLNTNYFDDYKNIFIVDLGVNKECADKINESIYKEKFRLLDHHISNIFLNEYEFASVIDSTNGFKECGTTLFYNYLIDNYKKPILSKKSVITFVELVREKDTWQFTDLEFDAHNLSSLFSFYGIDEYIEVYTKFLKENDEFYFTKHELIILKSLNREREEYLQDKKDKVMFRRVNGYNIGIVFAERHRSTLGNYLARIYKDEVDLICIINLNNHISLRGIKESKPVNKFAEIYGGGGHVLAAGMPYSSDLKEKIIDYIFGDNNENK